MFQDVDNHDTDHFLTNVFFETPAFDAYQEPIRVSSCHHQMMIPGAKGIELGITHKFEARVNTYDPLATYYLSEKMRDDPEWDTEVVWYDHTNSLCYQPHPEYNINNPCQEYFFDLVNYFFFEGESVEKAA